MEASRVGVRIVCTTGGIGILTRKIHRIPDGVLGFLMSQGGAMMDLIENSEGNRCLLGLMRLMIGEPGRSL